MYHTNFTREIARQHQSELVREAHAYSARHRYQRKVKATRRRHFHVGDRRGLAALALSPEQ